MPYTPARARSRAALIPWAAVPAAAGVQRSPRATAHDTAYVAGFARGLAVIRAFSNRREPLAIADVARRAGLSRAAARRLLHTLVALGYASGDGGAFTLLPQALLLGSAFLSSNAMAEHGQVVVTRLSAASGMFCCLDVPQQATSLIVCLAQREVPREVTLPSAHVGMVAPLHCTGSGLLFLAAMPASEFDDYLRSTSLHPYTQFTTCDPQRLRQRAEQARADGHAICDREMTAELRSVSVPVRGAGGRTVAALTTMASPALTSLAELQTLLPAMQSAALELGAQL